MIESGSNVFGPEQALSFELNDAFSDHAPINLSPSHCSRSAEDERFARNQVEVALFRQQSILFQRIDCSCLFGQILEHPVFKVFYMGQHMHKAIENFVAVLHKLQLGGLNRSNVEWLNARVCSFCVSQSIYEVHVVHRAMLKFKAQMEWMRQSTHKRDHMRLLATLPFAIWAR